MSTKKLAKELGLLRQRSHSSGQKKTLLSNQIFSYLIVIDFESTCWREKRNQNQEIIEFPAVLLNTSSGDIESEFHTYVQPQEQPLLSEFCTELTGITQTQVEAGVPLHICLSQFARWLQKLQLEKAVVFPNKQQGCSAAAAEASQKLCTFLTWSDWDLGVCLQFECKRKQIHKPDVVNSWIDLRSTYRLFYNKKPKGLNGALQDLGIQFCGREHSGLDDARNTARLAARMMTDGCVMKITRSLERTPAVLRPPPCPSDGKKETPDLSTKEKANTTKRPSSTGAPRMKSRPGSKSAVLNAAPNSVEPVCQSLISPKTLLNGTTVRPWGNVGRSSLSSHGFNGSLVLCSTVVGCLSHLPQRQPAGGEQQQEEEEELITEEEDRCGCYDDVVLEGDDVAVETEAAPKLDSEKHFTLAQTTCVEKLKTTDPPKTSKCSNEGGAGVSVLLEQAEPAGCFAAPPPVAWSSSSKLRSMTDSLLKGSFLVPGRTSTPHGSASRGAFTPHTRRKETPKSSFSIYTDPVNQSVTTSSSSSFSRKTLSALSTNTFNISASVKAGWKATSPLCTCGRRTKRLLVSNGGPNHGRSFYCCAVRRSGSGCQLQEGCRFFQWEPAQVRGGSATSPAARGSVSLCHMVSTLSSRPPQRAALRKSY